MENLQGWQVFPDSGCLVFRYRGGLWDRRIHLLIRLSRNPVSIPEKLLGTVSCFSENPVDLVMRLSTQGAKHLYVDGGITIQRFLAAGLLFRYNDSNGYSIARAKGESFPFSQNANFRSCLPF